MLYKKILISLVSLPFFFFGCRNDINMAFVPDEQYKFIKSYLEILRQKQYDRLDSVLTPELKSQIPQDFFARIAYIFPAEENPAEILFIGSNHVNYSDSTTTEMTFQYKFNKHYVLADLFVVTKDKTIKIAGIHINPIKESVATINAFSFSGKSIKHYIFLAAAAIILLFILFTFVLCLRTKIKKKWLWAIFVLIGIMKITLNWTTGEIAFSIFFFQLLGSSVMSSGPYAPWYVAISFPLGTVLFLIKRKKLIELNKQVPEDIMTEEIINS